MNAARPLDRRCTVKRFMIASMLALGLATGAQAESKAYTACMSKAGGVTVEMLDCISAEYSRQDIRLNQAYGRAMHALSPEKQQQLRVAQRAWLVTRDACNRISNTGGSLDSLVASSCTLEQTIKRAK